MNYNIKAVSHKIISMLPMSEHINYFIQSKILKSLPGTEHYFKIKVNEVINEHWRMFRENNSKSTSEVNYFEFGVGWDLIHPIAYSLIGVKNVVVADIKKLIFPDLVSDTLKKFQKFEGMLGFEYAHDIKRLVSMDLNDNNILDFLERELHITYLAPADVRSLNYPDNYFDIIATTTVLEHIPFDALNEIFKECYRVLSEDGIFSNIIDYKDHYSYVDRNVHIFNYLKYSSKQWAFYNSSMHYQNRLRHSDYLSLLKDNKFNNFYIRPVLDIPIEQLKSFPINGEFSQYNVQDLFTSCSHIVSKK